MDAATGASSGDKLIGNDCGALLAALETVASDAGYSVVSYKYLADLRTDVASEKFGIDVVFELDQLDPGNAAGATATAKRLEFFQQTDAYDRKPLNVTRDTALRCKRYADEMASNLGDPTNGGMGITLSAKAVSTTQGIALFSYRKFVQLDSDSAETGEGASREARAYFGGQGSYDRSPPPPPVSPIQKHILGHATSKKAAGIGGGLLGVGLPLLIGGLAIKASNGETTELSGAFTFLGALSTGVGGLMVLGGAGGMIGHKLAAEKKLDQVATYQLPPPPPANFEAADLALCRGDRVVYPPWEQRTSSPTTDVPAPAASQSVYEFNETTASQTGSDAMADMYLEQLAREVAEDMFNEIRSQL